MTSADGTTFEGGFQEEHLELQPSELQLQVILSSPPPPWVLHLPMSNPRSSTTSLLPEPPASLKGGAANLGESAHPTAAAAERPNAGRALLRGQGRRGRGLLLGQTPLGWCRAVPCVLSV